MKKHYIKSDIFIFGDLSQGLIQDFSQGRAPSDKLVLECYWMVYLQWWISVPGVGARPSAHPLDPRLSRTYIIRLTANLRAQIDSGDPGQSFGWLTILPASKVIEIIAIFCENSPSLRKFYLFWPPVTSNLTWSKNVLSIFVELATAYPTPFTACRYLS